MNLGRNAIAVIAGFVILMLILLAVHMWQKSRSAASQARVERSQSEAASNSARDAIGTVSASGEREAASEDLTRSNEKEIRNAEGATTRVGGGVDAAGRRALCLRESYRDDPKCRVFKSNPR